MKITVSQGTNIAGRFPDCIKDTGILTKHVILPCKSHLSVKLAGLRGNIENWQLVLENNKQGNKREQIYLVGKC